MKKNKIFYGLCAFVIGVGFLLAINNTGDTLAASDLCSGITNCKESNSYVYYLTKDGDATCVDTFSLYSAGNESYCFKCKGGGIPNTTTGSCGCPEKEVWNNDSKTCECKSGYRRWMDSCVSLIEYEKNYCEQMKNSDPASGKSYSYDVYIHKCVVSVIDRHYSYYSSDNGYCFEDYEEYNGNCIKCDSDYPYYDEENNKCVKTEPEDTDDTDEPENSGSTVEPVTYYTVKYDLDGGKFINDSTSRTAVIISTMTLETPKPNPVKEGYEFIGWYQGDNEFTGFNKLITGNLTLKAKYKKSDEYKTKSCAEGDLYDPSTNKCLKIQMFNNSKTLASIYDQTRSCVNSLFTMDEGDCSGNCNKEKCSSGYTSESWKSNDTCLKNSSCNSSGTSPCNRTYETYCYKTYDPENSGSTVEPVNYYTVKYDLDGGKFVNDSTSRTAVIISTKALEAPKPNPVKEGYEFIGWYQGDNKFTGFNKLITGNLTLKAKYKKSDEYKTKSCAEGDLYDPSTDKCLKIQMFNNNKTLASTFNQTRSCVNSLFSMDNGTCTGNCDQKTCSSGYTSESWKLEDTCLQNSSCSSSGTSSCIRKYETYCYKTYDPGQEPDDPEIPEDTGQPREYYTVKYDLDGGKFVNDSTSRTVIVSSLVLLETPKPNPVKEGYEFIGWYQGDNKFTGFNKLITGNLTLKAKYKKSDEYKTKSCADGDLYDPATNKCLKIQMFDNSKTLASTFNHTRGCVNSLFTMDNGTCTGNCDQNTCSSDYTKESWKLDDTCLQNSSCNSSGTSSCIRKYETYCYKTYNPENSGTDDPNKNGDNNKGDNQEENKDELKDGDNPDTGDIIIPIVLIIGIIAFCCATFYYNKTRNNEV